MRAVIMSRLGSSMTLVQLCAFLLGAVLPTACTTPSNGAQQVPEMKGVRQNESQCFAKKEKQVALRLPNDDIPWVAASSSALSDGRWLVTGSPSFVWPAGAPNTFVPTADAFVGITLSPSGAVTMVANPIRGRHALFPRVASTRNGWNVLLFESRLPDESALNASDSVGLWYGEYRDDRWFGIRRITWLKHLRFRPEYASQLVADGQGHLGFAYPMMSAARPARAEERGLVLLRFSGSNWAADTLLTPEPVVYVSLVSGLRPGTWNVLYQTRVVDARMKAPGSLFLADFAASSWRTSAPRILGQRGSLNGPSLFRMGMDFFVTWWEAAGSSEGPQYDSVRWAELIDSTTLVAASAGVVARDASEFVVARLADGKAIWAMRDRASSDRVRLAYADWTDIENLGSIRVPNDSYPHIIAVDAHHFLLLTAKIGKIPGEPEVEQILTALAISCR
jgi:hypothetical protein